MESDVTRPSVLVENGSYRMDNLGDVAMLQVAVGRVLERLPGARVRVVTEAPERLLRACPGVEPLAASPWFRLPVLPLPHWLVRTRLGGKLRWREKLYQGAFPRLAHLGKLCNVQGDVEEAAKTFFAALRDADAVICTGGGVINDPFHEHSMKVLTTLSAAQGLGKPTATFGLGLGPVTRQDVRRLARRVLSRLDVLALRESAGGLDELASLGLPRDRALVTGDDAIELACRAKPLPLSQRTSIGVNLRLAPHAELDPQRLPVVVEGVLSAAGELAAPLRALPVRSRFSPQNDVDALRSAFDDSIDLAEAEAIELPQELIAAIAGCRVVVTGAYHAAVFALALGIPTVGLARSRYYWQKLSGVAEQFSAAGWMELLDYEQADLAPRLREAMMRLWSVAADAHEPLRAAARRQVQQGRAAYARFFEHVA